MVRDSMGLRNKVYDFKNYQEDGYKRGMKSVLIVRELGQLRNIIIPFFYKRLSGYKKYQFEKWVENIGSDPDVPSSYKNIFFLMKAGFYDDYLRTGDFSPIRDIEL